MCYFLSGFLCAVIRFYVFLITFVRVTRARARSVYSVQHTIWTLIMWAIVWREQIKEEK